MPDAIDEAVSSRDDDYAPRLRLAMADLVRLDKENAALRAERDDFRNAAKMYAATVDELRQYLDRANAQVDRYGAIAETARALCLKASPGRELHIDGPVLRAEFRAFYAAVVAEHARRHGHVALSIDADPPGAWASIDAAASLLPTPPTTGSNQEEADRG